MKKYFRRSIAITNEHGSWVFLLSPLLIGLFAGTSWSTPAIYLFVAALCAFLIRQPIAMAVKAYSGRRPKHDLPAARFWIIVYGSLGLLVLLGLILRGFGFLLYLALPGIPVFAWHLFLVSQRRERRQMGVEIIASGVLALSAPAGYWIGLGSPDFTGWLLWGLTWLQSAASIVHAFLRLEQRVWDEIPDLQTRFRAGKRALLYTSFNLTFVVLLSLLGILSPWLFLPFLIQWLETLWGISNPAVGFKPTSIGFRQLAVSIAFTIVFILVWN
ncbi:MAG: YwiC-like family protein [Anaerolineales bacterium]|nr:YwiC-like family protein [Chloroflexota bacterium]MBL6982191.1 YwiC-like family protein [Anaerolineales bacterium]